MPLSIGAASVDITPPQGIPLVGYWFLRHASGVLDPLQAQALILSDGDSRAVLISVDVCFLPTHLADRVADKIGNFCDFSRDSIFISCTHTHTGPALQPLMNPEETSTAYVETLLNRLVQVVEKAMGSLTPARSGLGISTVQNVAFNRRLLNPQGRVITYKPDTYAAGLQPAGLVDPNLRLLSFYSTQGSPLAILINFGLHPDTIGGTLVSADYPGVLRKTLKHQLNGQPEVLFLNGPCGDINHLNPFQPRPAYSRENAVRIGKRLASSALLALRHLEWLPDARIRFARRPLLLHTREADPVKLENARAVVDQPSPEPTKSLVRARNLLEISTRAGESVNAEVSAIALGDAVLLGLPGELFTQFGLEIRKASRFPFALITGLTNGYIGYLPTREAFSQGGYETELGKGSFLEVGAGEKLSYSAQALLLEMYKK